MKIKKYFSQYMTACLFLISSSAAFSHGGGIGGTYSEKTNREPVMVQSPEITESQAIGFLENGLSVMRTIARQNGNEAEDNIESLMTWHETNRNMQNSINALKYYIEKGYDNKKQEKLKLLDVISLSLLKFKIFLSKKNTSKINKEIVIAGHALQDLSKRMGH